MIPFNDPGRSVALSRKDIDAAIDRVLRSGWLVLGPENEALANEISDFLEVDHAVLVGNGTDALEIALRCLDLQPDDQVVTVANAGGYASTAIRQIGAIPVYVDVDEETLQMNPHHLIEVLEERAGNIAAIVVTHLFGHAAPIQRIASIAKNAGIALVEDCAQAIGARVGGQSVGTFGEIATTSFYPTKNLGALGDGGAIFTGSSELANKAQQLRQYGWSDRYNSVQPGGRNSRLDEIQAAILRLRLQDLEVMTLRRQEIYRAYQSIQSPWGYLPLKTTEAFVAHLAIFVSDRRDELATHLANHRIGTSIHYPLPDYLQPGFMAPSASLSVTDKMAGRILSLPLFPELSSEEVERVCLALAAE